MNLTICETNIAVKSSGNDFLLETKSNLLMTIYSLGAFGEISQWAWKETLSEFDLKSV